MVFGREHEISRASVIPEWLREFAEDALRRSADGSNPFQEIRNLFQRNKDLCAIEDRVRELKDRIGLSSFTEREAAAAPIASPAVKRASLAVSSGLDRLVRLANWLDELGLEDEAREIDDMICVRAAKENAKCVFKKFPKLKTFVDNVIRSRGGHVTVPAVLKMIRDERPDESSAASDETLREYVEGKIKEEKKDINDASDNVAGFGVGLTTSWDDIQDENRMFESSKPAR